MQREQNIGFSQHLVDKGLITPAAGADLTFVLLLSHKKVHQGYAWYFCTNLKNFLV